MKSDDSRGPDGGFFPAQDWRKDRGVLERQSKCAFRIIGESADPWAKPVEDKEARGDMSGFFFWKPAAGDQGRAVGTWREVMPVITVAPTVTPKREPKPEAPIFAPVIGNGPGYYSPIFGGFVGSAQPDPFDATWGTAFYQIGGSGLPAGALPGVATKSALASGASTGTGGGTQQAPNPAPPPLIYIRIDNPDPFGPVPFPSPPPAPPGYAFTGSVYAHEIGGPPSPGGTGHLTGTDYWQYEYRYVGGDGTGSDGGGNPDGGTGDPTHPGSAGDGPDFRITPIVGTSYNPSFAMAALNVDIPNRIPGWPRFPINHYMAVVQTIDHGQQIEFVGSVDPRMPAVNFAGGGACGAIVADLRPDSSYDDTRLAHLQSAFRVLKKPRVKVGANAKYAGLSGNGNAIALQFGVSGQGDSPGGFVFDATQAVAAKWSYRDGGCMNCGGGTEKHVIGSDADGNPIHGMHLDTLSLFTNGAQDGPFVFEPKAPALADDGFYVQRVHIGFKADEPYDWPRPSRDKSMTGCWVPWVRVPLTVVTPKDPPKPPVPGPVTPGGGDPGLPGPVTPGGGPSGQPTTPSGASSSSGGRNFSVLATIARNASYIVTDYRQNLVTLGEIAGPGILARPQRYVGGEPDLRYAQGWGNADAVAWQETRAPVTARLSAYGAQGGKQGGPYLTPASGGTQVGTETGWKYTQRPGVSRHIGGTAAGGFVLLPPEVDVSDVDDSFAPSALTRSTSYLVMAPGAWMGVGTPELATGGVKNGWSFGQSNTDDMLLQHHNSTGVTDSRMLFRSASVLFVDGYGMAFDVSSGTRIGLSSAQKFAFHGASPIAQDTGWTITSPTTLRSLDVSSATLGDVRQFLGTLAQKLIDKGLIGA